MFFFEKKNQKTSINWDGRWDRAGLRDKSFFGSFFSKKEHPSSPS
jgi:hypothetical protein